MVSAVKIIYVVSDIQKSLSFEWTARSLKDSCDLTFVIMNPKGSALENYIKAQKINFIYISYRRKLDLPFAFIRLLWIFITQKPDVVHTHLFDATIAGLAAAWISRVRKRIYTRHTSTYHHNYFPAGVKYDKLCNSLATKIISISQATDYALVNLEQVDRNKIARIPHGFDFIEFLTTTDDRIRRVRNRWGIPAEGYTIGIIARHIEWKGIQYVLAAFKEFITQNPHGFLVLANSTGPFRSEVLHLLKDIPQQNYVLIEFEEDIAALYSLLDVLVHVPVDRYCEAFGQTYIEGLAHGVPSIFTLSGIAAEFVVDREHALVVDFKNSWEIKKALMEISSNSGLRQAISKEGKRYVLANFGIGPMLDALKKVYNE